MLELFHIVVNSVYFVVVVVDGDVTEIFKEGDPDEVNLMSVLNSEVISILTALAVETNTVIWTSTQSK